MKNHLRKPEIKSEDFDSFLMWRAFLKLIASETPVVFCLKVLICGAFFIALVFFIFLFGE